MPRIRTIKPEFWADEKLSLLDPLTRLVFLGLISMADDAGRLVDNVKLLDGMLFPSTDDTCRESLETLARIGRISRYRSGSGQELIQVVTWSTHQRVDHPSPYVLPGPDTAVLEQPAAASADRDSAREPARGADADSDSAGSVPSGLLSGNSRERLARLSRSDLRPTTRDPGPTSREQVSLAAHALAIRANQGLAEHPEYPQPIPRIMPTSGGSYAAAEAILGQGVPLDFAEATIYDLARSHAAGREVRSLRYFVDALARSWEEAQTAAAVATAPRPARTDRQATSRQPSSNGRAAQSGAGGEAALLLGKIRALRRENQQPGQAATQFIPKAKVRELGAEVLQAYEAIGGAERILTTTGEKWSFLIRDFSQALEAARSGARSAREAPAHV